MHKHTLHTSILVEQLEHDKKGGKKSKKKINVEARGFYKLM